jgi:transcriptional regulator with XRE-family HTH domain
MMTSYEALIYLLRMVVKSSDMAAKNIAKLAGISPKHLSRIINGYHNPSLDLVDRIMAVCNTRLVIGIMPLTKNANTQNETE